MTFSGIRFHALPPWIAASAVISILDLVTPANVGLCVLQIVLQLAAFRWLSAKRASIVTAILIIATLVPGLVGLVRHVITSELDPVSNPSFWWDPSRIWVTLALFTGYLLHADWQQVRKRRLDLRQGVQRKVRRRSAQVRRINEALRREVARRQATQQRLNRTETHLQSLAQRMQLQVLRKDQDGVITYANDAFCRNVGRPINNVIGCTDTDLYPPETAQRYRADDQQVMASGVPVDHVEPHPMANGKTSWVQVFKAPDYNEDNECIGIQMVFWDVTETYRRTAELKRSEARKRAIFDAAREAILLVDNHGRVVEANPSAESLFCSGSGSIAGCLIDSIAQPFGHSSAVDVQSKSVGESSNLNNGISSSSDAARRPFAWNELPTSERREMKVRRHDQTVFPAEVSVHPIPLENSQGVAVFVRDVTLRHQTLQVLQEAKQVAEAASRSKSEFMASVSHEIRTPLGGITGSADLLSRMDLPARAQQYVKMIRNSGELLSGVIGDILDFASMEAGKLQIDPIPIDLHECVGEAFRLLATRASGKTIELILSIAPNTPRSVLADPQRLRQIVINLAGNAIKFTADGYVELRLSYRDQQIVIEAIDSGIGIAKELHAKIFEPFEQGDSSTTRKFGGTGLGLSISRKLAIQMGGSLELESVVGMGSTFRCTLPLPLIESPDAKRELLQAEAANVGVDLAIRHPEQRQAIHDTLVSYGYKIDSPGNVCIADDSSLATTISALDTATSSRKLIWLARANDSETKIARRAHAVLIKPVVPDDLLRVLKGMLSSSVQEMKNETANDVSIEPDAPSPPGQQTDGIDSSPEGIAASEAKLLIVDDSEVNRTVIRDFLALAGYASDSVTGGLEAIRRCLDHPQQYQVILMDLQMPEMDGVETTEQLFASYASFACPAPAVIALTAHATTEHEQRCLAAGMKHFLRKPVVPEELIDVVDSILMPQRQSFGQSRTATKIVATSDAPAWQQTMLRLSGGNDATMRSLAEAFCDEVPQLCNSIKRASQEGNLKEVRRAAHTLKSCLKYVAPASDWQIAESLELAALNEQRNEVERLQPLAFQIADRWHNTVAIWMES